jgi:two-component system sensor histidine kinase KdpD
MYGLLLPLSVRERVVGVLRLRVDRGLRLDAERWRFVDALSYYAALGIERVRLIAAVERAEAQREADELKDALLASISHDLRTPLTTIQARAHEMRVHGDDQAEVIEQEADRLNRIVVDLLDLSRLKAGVLPTSLELNAVDELLELVVQRVEGVLDGRPLVVRLSPDGELLFGRFDLTHSVRILVTLVENAHKYAPTDTVIELNARRSGERIEVTVADRGPGIPLSERERAFEPFNRSPGLPPDVGGAGLGLAIARRLAEAQGASLRYESREGGGSVFTYSIPSVAFVADEA